MYPTRSNLIIDLLKSEPLLTLLWETLWYLRNLYTASCNSSALSIRRSDSLCLHWGNYELNAFSSLIWGVCEQITSYIGFIFVRAPGESPRDRNFLIYVLMAQILKPLDPMQNQCGLVRNSPNKNYGITFHIGNLGWITPEFPIIRTAYPLMERYRWVIAAIMRKYPWYPHRDERWPSDCLELNLGHKYNCVCALFAKFCMVTISICVITSLIWLL